MNVVSGAFRRHKALAAVGLVSLCSLACSSGTPGGSNGANSGAGAPGQTGTGGANANGAGSGSGGDGTGGSKDLTNGGPKLRVLTQSEYRNAVSDLVGTVTTALTLPDDTRTAGFASIGGGQVSINSASVDLYETAARAIAAEVFADNARWQKLVGCQPKTDLSDACVTTFIQTFGKHAFRRDLTADEVKEWLTIGQETAQLSNSASQGLSAIVSGLLQSPFFLYRIEVNQLDATSKRLKYDGASMATRLAFALTGHQPTDALLAAAASGQLDTAEGIKTAVAPLLMDSKVTDRMTEFFSELSQADIVNVVQKDMNTYASFTPAMRGSMFQATQMFIKNIVLAPNADVRSLFDSNQTFVDATLAPIYGVTAPASGFMQITLGAETGRAGILGQAGVIAGHSQSDHSSPTRRGVFITTTFLCQKTPDPPPGVITTLPADPTLSARKKLDQHRSNTSCASCHGIFDPPGLALEHLDPIGKYRADENGLTIDATGTLDGVNYDGEAQLGAALRQNARAMTCMMGNFYRNANGVPDSTADSAQIDSLVKTLASKNYVWRDLVAEFVASDAFRSAPAAAATAGNQ